MDRRQLRYFVAIVETGSFSRAAERVHVAQSALSLHVRRMEEALGVTLLERDHKGVQPTNAGLKLMEHAQVILAQFSLAERDLRSEREQPSGMVAVGIPAGAGRALIGALLEAARSEYPKITLQVIETVPAHTADWLQEGRIKLAVNYAPLSDALADQIATEDFYLVCGAPEADLRDTIEINQLVRFPLVLPSEAHSAHQSLHRESKARGASITVASEVDSLFTILDLVRTGQARTVLTPASFIREWREGLVHAYRITPSISRSVVVSAGAAGTSDPAAHAVIQLIRSVAKRLVDAGEWPSRLPSLPGPSAF